MSMGKGILSLVATAAIAAVVAYSVSAPRNVDAVMNQDMEALGGQSINEHVAEVQADVARERCDKQTRMAQEAWNRAVERGTAERDAATLDELDRQAKAYCKL